VGYVTLFFTEELTSLIREGVTCGGALCICVCFLIKAILLVIKKSVCGNSKTIIRFYITYIVIIIENFIFLLEKVLFLANFPLF